MAAARGQHLERAFDDLRGKRSIRARAARRADASDPNFNSIATTAQFPQTVQRENVVAPRIA
jgi:hypothetical protein